MLVVTAVAPEEGNALKLKPPNDLNALIASVPLNEAPDSGTEAEDETAFE